MIRPSFAIFLFAALFIQTVIVDAANRTVSGNTMIGGTSVDYTVTRQEWTSTVIVSQKPTRIKADRNFIFQYKVDRPQNKNRWDVLLEAIRADARPKCKEFGQTEFATFVNSNDAKRYKSPSVATKLTGVSRAMMLTNPQVNPGLVICTVTISADEI